MNPFDEQFRNAAKKNGLSDTERGRIRDVLIQEISLHPVPYYFARKIGAGAIPVTLGRSTHKALGGRMLRRFIPASVVMALLLGSGISYAAESSVPGDALYPVKIYVNEGARSTVAISNTDEAKLGIDLAERRLEEAEILEQNARLSDEKKIELKKRFDEHTARVDAQITKIKKKDEAGADSIHRNLNNRLRGHSAALQMLDVSFNEESGGLRNTKEGENDLRNEEGVDSASATNARPEQKDDSAVDSMIDVGSRDEDSVVEHGNTSREFDDYDKDEGDGGEEDDGERPKEHSKSGSLLLESRLFARSSQSVAPDSSVHVYTVNDVAMHNTRSSCFTVIGGAVYDVASFISSHPGGESAILGMCGRDGSLIFANQHGGQSKPENALAAFRVGNIASP